MTEQKRLFKETVAVRLDLDVRYALGEYASREGIKNPSRAINYLARIGLAILQPESHRVLMARSQMPSWKFQP
jgi:hypothetical protein